MGNETKVRKSLGFWGDFGVGCALEVILMVVFTIIVMDAKRVGYALGYALGLSILLWGARWLLNKFDLLDGWCGRLIGPVVLVAAMLLAVFCPIKTDKADGESRYHYDISVQALYDMVKEDGASIFYRASDYDTFCASYELNKDIITAAKCTVDFTVNGSGNMTLLDAKITANGKTYGLTCRMSDFGKTEVEIPEGFLKEAQITLPE